MIKRIKKLDVIYNGDLLIDDVTEKKVKEVWNEFIKGKKACEFYDGDIYCVTKIDDFVPLIDVSKTKYSCLIYAKETNNLTIRSFFSAGYIKTIDNYICIILNNRDSLNAIGGIADSRDIINNKLDYYSCFIREFKEELGIDIRDNANFEMMLKYLKYPSGKELEDAFYPVGTIYEIKTKYTKDELITIFNNSLHEDEVKELKFYNVDNYKEIYLCNKIDYLGELFDIIFDGGIISE